MKVSHCYFSMRIGGVEQNLLRTLPRFLEDSQFEHELILSHGSGPLMKKLPKKLTVHILEAGSRFQDLSRRLKETDLVHLYTINHSPFYREAAFLHNTPVVDNIRNMISCPAPQRVDFIGCASQAIGNMQSAPPRVRIIPNGLEVDKNQQPDYGKFSSESPPVLLEVGRPDKIRLFTAENLVPALRRRFPDLTCHVVGREGEDSEGIIYHGEIADPRPFYRRAHFLIHFPELEPFGMTVPESYRDGVIPIAGGKGGISELIVDQKTGFYLRQPDVRTIIDKIERLIIKLREKPEKLKKLAVAGFERLLDKYSISSYLRGYEKLYADLACSARTSPLPEIKWSDDFCALFEKISFSGKDNFDWISSIDDLGGAPEERDWARLYASGKLSTARPSEVIELLSGLESKRFKTDFEYYLRRCEALAFRGKPAVALEAARSAIKTNPEIANPYFLGAELLLRQDRPRQARLLLQKFRNYAPSYPPLEAMLSKLNQIC